MKVAGKHYRTIGPCDGGSAVEVIDQTRLPHEFVHVRLRTLEDAVAAIRDMIVRGAPLIGATGAYGMVLALRAESSDAAMNAAADRLKAARPTAVNLRWGVDSIVSTCVGIAPSERPAFAAQRAAS